MNNNLDNSDKIISLFNNAIILVTTVSGLIISCFNDKNNKLVLIIFFIILIANVFFIFHHIRKIKYINFVEYLFYNPIHRFTLLPKFRVFIEKYHKINKIHILKFNINYLISKNQKYQDTEIGDLIIEYKMTIKNKNLPKEFNLVFGNDYAKDKPIVRAYFSDIETVVTFNEFHHSSYERGLVNDVSISLCNDNLPKSEFELKIIMNYKNSFNFTDDPTDTLVLLPLMFASRIDRINYCVTLKDFNYEELYMSSHEISSKNILGNYSVKTLPNTNEGDMLCKKTELKNISRESAYFFRISVADKNMEV